MKRFLQLMMIVVIGLGFTSCDNQYYNDAPFLGTWESIRYGENGYEYDLRLDEFHKYVFYSDGTGVYRQYDGLVTRFFWDDYPPNKLQLRQSDGLNEYLYYDFDGRYMLLSTHSNFRTYYLYEPIW